ncbi:Uncharacterized membrane protein YsdA, DUF1294 family [Amphritea atlantica]|uniref:Uncharacterized membrane protein YsdA, DUF1294 family n=1 Tax=Amphritea atlantica TaxID=355243 RepID=A0A1H9IMC3_9GAMM|nr:DUF1294 domain-containing protein [Amphritea atlantica]SEQ75706.1 Uncharacterized membrane protein YsdA, DUF1294 family [Amphritea atlantica]
MDTILSDISMLVIPLQIVLFWLSLWLILRFFSSTVIATWLTNGLFMSSVAALLIVNLGAQLNVDDALSLRGLLTGQMIGMNFVVMPFYYWLDKRRSFLVHTSRAPEVVLHSLSFLGGAGGALVSQKYFHHKTVKPGFRAKTWVAFTVNLVLFYAILFYIP